jgi:hypothetical protein
MKFGLLTFLTTVTLFGVLPIPVRLAAQNASSLMLLARARPQVRDRGPLLRASTRRGKLEPRRARSFFWDPHSPSGRPRTRGRGRLAQLFAGLGTAPSRSIASYILTLRRARRDRADLRAAPQAAPSPFFHGQRL